jgi:hypothetical protein
MVLEGVNWDDLAFECAAAYMSVADSRTGSSPVDEIFDRCREALSHHNYPTSYQSPLRGDVCSQNGLSARCINSELGPLAARLASLIPQPAIPKNPKSSSYRAASVAAVHVLALTANLDPPPAHLALRSCWPSIRMLDALARHEGHMTRDRCHSNTPRGVSNTPRSNDGQRKSFGGVVATW